LRERADEIEIVDGLTAGEDRKQIWSLIQPLESSLDSDARGGSVIRSRKRACCCESGAEPLGAGGPTGPIAHARSSRRLAPLFPRSCRV
jgi:hypothetical protein